MATMRRPRKKLFEGGGGKAVEMALDPVTLPPVLLPFSARGTSRQGHPAESLPRRLARMRGIGAQNRLPGVSGRQV